MKTLNLFFAAVLGQDGPGVDSSRKMSFDQKVENARTKCQYYMNKAMVCDRPASKISKYTHRFEKVTEFLSNIANYYPTRMWILRKIPKFWGFLIFHFEVYEF